MADFTDKTAMGTSRMNPSSMVPGASGNAPQGGLATQRRMPAAQKTPQSEGSRQALANQLMQQPQPTTQVGRLTMPQHPSRTGSQSELPTHIQQMLPQEKKSRSYKKEDFQLLSDVFKTLSER